MHISIDVNKVSKWGMLDWWHFFKSDVCQNAIITWIQRTADIFCNFIYYALQHMTKTFIDRWYLDSFQNLKKGHLYIKLHSLYNPKILLIDEKMPNWFWFKIYIVLYKTDILYICNTKKIPMLLIHVVHGE